MVVGVSAANVNDVQALRPLVLGIPAVRSRRGPHRQRPDKVRADKAYHSAGNMVWLRERHITPRIAGRATKRQPLPGLARARRSHDLLQEARQDRHVRHRLRRADRLLRQLLRCCACLPGTPPGRAHQPPDLPW
ncbi:MULTISPECIES: transposase [Streptomyces]|uniref:transposase n=1 Tax=Streptomyces TaxID=1883 RepID=UPI001F3C428E